MKLKRKFIDSLNDSFGGEVKLCFRRLISLEFCDRLLKISFFDQTTFISHDLICEKTLGLQKSMQQFKQF